jgi:hypothetical protein
MSFEGLVSLAEDLKCEYKILTIGCGDFEDGLP